MIRLAIHRCRSQNVGSARPDDSPYSVDVLGARDAITWWPQRVTIAGVSGAGKSTLARRIASISHVPYVELDALYHGPGWTPRPDFLSDVDELIRGSTWVTEWQYGAVKNLIAARADTMVWLDLPSPLAFSRVLRRTVRRRLRRQQLWNGNVEPRFRTIITDRDHILRWAIRTRNKLRTSVPHLEREFPHLWIVRLRSQREVDDWIGALSQRVQRDG